MKSIINILILLIVVILAGALFVQTAGKTLQNLTPKTQSTLSVNCGDCSVVNVAGDDNDVKTQIRHEPKQTTGAGGVFTGVIILTIIMLFGVGWLFDKAMSRADLM